MRSFKDQPINSRLRKLGDEAENVFRQWAPNRGIAFVDYGLNRPPFNYFPNLDSTLRHTPDFLCEIQGKKFAHIKDKRGYQARHMLVDAKGFGKDQTLKLKEEDLKSLRRWHELQRHPIVFFAWDSKNRRVSMSLTFDGIKELTDRAEVGYFEDGYHPKKYFKIPAEWLTWESFEPDPNPITPEA